MKSKLMKNPLKPALGTSSSMLCKFTNHQSLNPYGSRPAPVPDSAPFRSRHHPTAVHSAEPEVRTSPWLHKATVEDWSKNLGYRNQAILKTRWYLQTIRGPAWYTVSEPPGYEPKLKNLSFGRTARFKSSKSDTPGPGVYFREQPTEPAHGPHSRRPTFLREEACRFPSATKSWSLPPNRYIVIDKDSIEQKPNKAVSKRGPYELFTGKRDMTTIKNHFNFTPCSAATWPYDFPRSFKVLKKSHLGVMNKTGRDKMCRDRNMLVNTAMAYHSPSDPGPAHYNPDKPKAFKQLLCGFNRSDEKGPGYQRQVVWPGVGRYTVRAARCGANDNGHRHVFKSKVPRIMGYSPIQKFNTF